MTKKNILRYAKLLYAIKYKGRYCKFCRIDGFENPWIMDFHHTEPETKTINVKNRISTGLFETFREELDKCMLLCSHCHRTHHSNIKEYREFKKIIMSKLASISKLDGFARKCASKLTEENRKQICSLAVEGKTIKEIATELDLKYDRVKLTLQERGIGATRDTMRRTLPIKGIIKLYKENKNSTRFIAKKFATTPGVIQKILKENGLEIRQNFRINKAEIKKLLNEGLTTIQIARKLNLRYGSIHRVVKKLL